MVVVDLKMPTSSERSFFGGFELVRRLKRFEDPTPVLLMAESLSDKAKARARELGIRRLVFKPALSKIDPELYRADLRDFAGTIEDQLQRLNEDGDPAPSGNGRGDAQHHPGRVDFLAEMTRKLVEPGGSTDISRLVLEVAARFLERGVLFVVKGDAARGLAAFGIGGGDEESAVTAQRITLDIAANPAVAEVVRRGSSYRVRNDFDTLEPQLLGEIGKGRAREAVLIPLLYNRATLLLLYGDNAVSGRGIEDIGGLELFMAQAGMALENKLLQRKLSTVDRQVVDGAGHDHRRSSRGRS